MLINTVFRNMPLGSCLSYQLQDFGRPNARFIHTINADMDSDINANNKDTQKCVEFSAILLVKPDQKPIDLDKPSVPGQS